MRLIHASLPLLPALLLFHSLIPLDSSLAGRLLTVPAYAMHLNRLFESPCLCFRHTDSSTDASLWGRFAARGAVGISEEQQQRARHAG